MERQVIYGDLNNIPKFLPKKIVPHLQFLRANFEEIKTMPTGEYYLGNKLQLLVQEYETEPHAGWSCFEFHKDWHDIHIMLDGYEYTFGKPISLDEDVNVLLKTCEYDAENDAVKAVLRTKEFNGAKLENTKFVFYSALSWHNSRVRFANKLYKVKKVVLKIHKDYNPLMEALPLSYLSFRKQV